MFKKLYNYLLEKNQIKDNNIDLLDFFNACESLDIYFTDQEIFDFEENYKVKIYAYI